MENWGVWGTQRAEWPEEGRADQNQPHRISSGNESTHPGGGAQDGGEGAPLHQLAQSGRRVERAHGHRRRVRVLFPDLLSGSSSSVVQQAGGAVEPRAQSSGLKNEAFRGCGKPERTRVRSCVQSAERTLDLHLRWQGGWTVLAPPSDGLRLVASSPRLQGGASAKRCRFPLLQRRIGLDSLTTQRSG